MEDCRIQYTPTIPAVYSLHILVESFSGANSVVLHMWQIILWCYLVFEVVDLDCGHSLLVHLFKFLIDAASEEAFYVKPTTMRGRKRKIIWF